MPAEGDPAPSVFDRIANEPGAMARFSLREIHEEVRQALTRAEVGLSE